MTEPVETREPPPLNPPVASRSWLGRLVRYGTQLGLLSIVAGGLSALIASFLQYSSWRQEQQLARYKEDLGKAIETFSDVSSTLASAMNLQQLIYFNYRGAIRDKVDTDKSSLQYKNANKVYDDYFKERTALRRNVDVVARKMEIFVDWPSISDPKISSVRDLIKDPIAPKTVIAAEQASLTDFDCVKHLPNFEKNELPSVDWYSTKHHVVTFYHCFDRIHYGVFAARSWAGGIDVTPEQKSEFLRTMDRTEDLLNSQITRLNAFMVLTMRRIEDIRQNYRLPSFVCHYTLVWCGTSK
ncbi:MAG TPA: hypothetical protein VKB96_02085 [Gammaproteobacteria bacterium]|nr:hypothetical protein [Gammaproteobacteria bacterium]